MTFYSAMLVCSAIIDGFAPLADNSVSQTLEKILVTSDKTVYCLTTSIFVTSDK
jgi:hypothetical protein